MWLKVAGIDSDRGGMFRLVAYVELMVCLATVVPMRVKWKEFMPSYCLRSVFNKYAVLFCGYLNCIFA